MKVGVYIDGYNLYYGGRRHCGSSGQSWKWIDPRALITKVLADQLQFAADQGWSVLTKAWSGAAIERVVYCTARIDSVQNPSGHADQDVYLKALVGARAVDHIEYGSYVSRAKVAPLALEAPHAPGAAFTPPSVYHARWPVMVKDQHRVDVPDAIFMVKYLHNEEKGSDVNVGSHLLLDVVSGDVEAAIVVSNDSDLRFPVAEARARVPLGLVNPQTGPTAGSLRPPHAAGQGPHWTRRLRPGDFLSSQLANPAAGYTRPNGW